MSAITTEKVYNPAETEKKWYDAWIEARLFKGENNSEKPPFSMTLPPPDTTGSTQTTIHALTFTIPDIILRRKKMQGLNTVWVSGLDRSDTAAQHEHRVISQLERLGLALDRDRDTPLFGNNMQKAITGIFVQLFGQGEIYRGSIQEGRETTEGPGVSTCWMLKTAGFTTPAVDAVEKGQINFIPGKWKKEFSRWIADTGNRRISRPGTWGHRVPAYYCRECGRTAVEEEKPAACTNCGAAAITPDPDVLDTWFTSTLWPVIALGGNENARGINDLYPAALFAGGFDAVFTRVAWMIMMGVRLGKDVPFKEVLFNGLIRDEKGRIIGSIKSNIVDPLELIDKYGADALRFTLAVRAVPGTDISLSAGRVKGYKAFVNKIWNASRYVLMNLEDGDDLSIDLRHTTEPDRWILNGLNNTVQKVNDLLDDYKIYEAAGLLYHFFWHEYCDWYLEFSRNDLQNPDSRKTLKITLYKLLQLMHPFMPFITEEIYRKLEPAGEPFLLRTTYPSFSADLAFPQEFTHVELLKKIIMETRKTRTENRVRPNRKVRVFLKTESAKEKKIVEKNMKYFDSLTKSTGTEITADLSSLPKGFRGAYINWEILLPIDNDEDRLTALARLKVEIETLENRAAGIEDQLADGNLMDKSQESTVSNLKKNLQETIDKRNRLRKTIDDLA